MLYVTRFSRLKRVGRVSKLLPMANSSRDSSPRYRVC